MIRLSHVLTTSAIALGLAAFASSPASAQANCDINGVDGGVNATPADGGASAIGVSSFACGPNAVASLEDNLAVGDGAMATGARSTALGTDTIASDVETLAVGYDATATGMGATAVGALADAFGGRGPTAIGWNANATDEEATAVGFNAQSTGFHSTAIGALADAIGRGATAIGWDSAATMGLSTAVGNSAMATGVESTAIGRSAVANQLNATALGQNAQAIHTNSVALGADTVTTAANQVNVGGRTIGNVANGVATTDAVNVSQLTATNAMIASEAASRASADAALSSRLDGLSFDIRDTAREARAGTASALAAAGLPQASGEGRTMIAGGVGTYRGKTAFAVGASHRLQGGNATLKVGVTYDSEKYVGANAGAGFEF